MDKTANVYEEWGSELIPSSHGENINYRVFHGTVNWAKTADGMMPALVVFIQYGSETDWSKALQQREISLNMPAHILDMDLDNVVPALIRLQAKNNRRKK